MFECQFRGPLMVEDDVCQSRHWRVSRDGDHRNTQGLTPGRINGDDALDGARQQQAGILPQQIFAMQMTDHKKEVAVAQQCGFHAVQHRGGIAFAKLGDHDADGVCALLAQRLCHHVWLVVEFFRGGEDALLGGGRYGAGAWGTIDDTRDRRRRESKVAGQLGQVGSVYRGPLRLFHQHGIFLPIAHI